jgi:hypothetical protein
MNISVRMDNLPNNFKLNISNSCMLMQMLPHNLKLTYVTPNAGRPQASRRAGAGKEKDMKTQFLKFPDWGMT